MSPEYRGMSRLTRVTPVLEKMGGLPVQVIEPEVILSVRGREDRQKSRGPWLVAHVPVISAALVATLVVAFAFSGVGEMTLRKLSAFASVDRANAWAELKPWVDPQLGASLLRAGSAFQPPADERDAAVTQSSPRELVSTATKFSGDMPAAIELTAQTAEPAAIPLLYAVIVSGLPTGSRISKGTPLGEGEWAMALDDLGQLVIDLPVSVTKPVETRFDISGRDGGVLASFPLLLVPKDVASPVGAPAAAAPTSNKLAAKPRQKQTSLDQPGTVTKAQKAKVSHAAQKASAGKTQLTKVSSAVTAPEADPAVDLFSDGSGLKEGSAGLETFKGFATASFAAVR